MNLKPLLVLSAMALIGFAAPTANARTYWSVGIGIGYPGYGYGYPSYGYPYYGYYPYRSYPYGYGYSSYPSYGYGYSPYSYGYSSYRPVYRGSSYSSNRGGSVVVQVQQRLARAGYYHGRVDGVMGSQTRSAIRSYQRAHSMRVDGMINDQLLGTMGLRR